jgi:uncharacterized protein YjiS (DUF1127 family)
MKNYLGTIVQNAKRRANARSLYSLDDRMLRDIGITRTEISLMMAGNRTAHTAARPDHE